jgi:protease II
VPESFRHKPQLPPARQPVANEYHGVKVIDDYQWLENANDPAVRAWSDQQNQRTRAYLDKLQQPDGLFRHGETYEQQLGNAARKAISVSGLTS